jgi:hypothetical protein
MSGLGPLCGRVAPWQGDRKEVIHRFLLNFLLRATLFGAVLYVVQYLWAKLRRNPIPSFRWTTWIILLVYFLLRPHDFFSSSALPSSSSVPGGESAETIGPIVGMMIWSIGSIVGMLTLIGTASLLAELLKLFVRIGKRLGPIVQRLLNFLSESEIA